MIKVKGNQVAPAELEGVLLEHPAISDAAVVGVTMYVAPSILHTYPQLTLSCRNGEELPRAYLVLQSNQTVKPEEIAKWLAKQVAPHKRLAGGVKIVDEIPKNPSGKILRKILREKAKEEVGDKVPKESRL